MIAWWGPRLRTSVVATDRLQRSSRRERFGLKRSNVDAPSRRSKPDAAGAAVRRFPSGLLRPQPVFERRPLTRGHHSLPPYDARAFVVLRHDIRVLVEHMNEAIDPLHSPEGGQGPRSSGFSHVGYFSTHGVIVLLYTDLSRAAWRPPVFVPPTQFQQP